MNSKPFWCYSELCGANSRVGGSPIERARWKRSAIACVMSSQDVNCTVQAQRRGNNLGNGEGGREGEGETERSTDREKERKRQTDRQMESW